MVDLGPADLSANLTGRALRGRGVTVIPAATEKGRDVLFTAGAEIKEAADWSAHAPRLIDRGDGSPVVDTAFTRLTGKSPILLAGMTPTTVDPEIVAAAANAGHWAELAGGGQVTEQIFADNVAKLTELLDEGRTAQFNTLFLDPYLWRMQVGNQRLLQKARLAGAPFDGLVLSAGIPDLEDAVDIIEDLHDAGITHVVFKPGTVKQIRQVLAIAREVDTSVIAHIEGGVAGGHHSWEDLEDLLLATYADLRSVDNLVVCVGGGIGTPERAVDFLTGRWAEAHGETAMPVDGVLIGTAAMATKEATTTDAVKQLLVDTPGVTRDVNGGWVGAGRSGGGRHLRAQPARRRHPRVRQPRLALRRPPRPGRRRRRGRARPQGRARRGDGRDRQALLRRRRRDDLRAAAAPLPRAERPPRLHGARPAQRVAGRHLRRALRGPPRPRRRARAPRDVRPGRADHLRRRRPAAGSATVDQLVSSYPEAASCSCTRPTCTSSSRCAADRASP